MVFEKLKRVIWRLKEMKPEQGPKTYSMKQFRRAIMEEIGYDTRTIYRISNRLQELDMVHHSQGDGWILV